MYLLLDLQSFKIFWDSISHDYPSEEEDKIDAINYLIEHIKELMQIVQTIKNNFEIIKRSD